MIRIKRSGPERINRAFVRSLDARRMTVDAVLLNKNAARREPESSNFQGGSMSSKSCVVLAATLLPGGGNIVRNTSVTRAGDFLLANSLVNGLTLVTIEK